MASRGQYRRTVSDSTCCMSVGLYFGESNVLFEIQHLKKAYIILLFFILRFVTLGGRCKAVVLHPQFLDQLPVPRGSTEKCYQTLTLPVYCFKIHNVCHFPFVVPDSIQH